jgi:hypothetical protein
MDLCHRPVRRADEIATVHHLFKPDDGGTLLTLTHEQLFDQDSRDGNEKGWNGSLDKLEKLVA